jgi:hypothetical protein
MPEIVSIVSGENGIKTYIVNTPDGLREGISIPDAAKHIGICKVRAAALSIEKGWTILIRGKPGPNSPTIILRSDVESEKVKRNNKIEERIKRDERKRKEKYEPR